MHVVLLRCTSDVGGPHRVTRASHTKCELDPTETRQIVLSHPRYRGGRDFGRGKVRGKISVFRLVDHTSDMRVPLRSTSCEWVPLRHTADLGGCC